VSKIRTDSALSKNATVRYRPYIAEVGDGRSRTLSALTTALTTNVTRR
jgi:hypothetical protein